MKTFLGGFFKNHRCLSISLSTHSVNFSKLYLKTLTMMKLKLLYVVKLDLTRYLFLLRLLPGGYEWRDLWP